MNPRAREERPPALPAAPRLSGELAEGNLADEPARLLREGEDAVRGFCFGGPLPGFSAEEADFERCVFEGMRLTGADFSRTGLTDLAFRRCDLSGADFSRAALTRVRFEDCKLVGADFSEGSLRDVCFARCNLQYAQFFQGGFRTARFEGCDLTRAGMQELKLKGLTLSETRLAGAELFHTPLAGVDFTTCETGGIVVGTADLRGAVFTPVQAAGLAGLLGIVVKPPVF